ncbi:hypothetical protein NHJ13734_009302 [Beauveria thailandica]
MHELHLWPFQDAIHARSGTIMCSYRRINNSYACANGKTLNGLRNTELGFQGFVVTDWATQHNCYFSQDARLLLPRVAAAVLSGSRSGSTGYKTILPDGAISGHLGDPEDTWRDHLHQNERYAAFGGCGSGATTPANAISPFEALETRAHGDVTAPFNDSVCLAAAGRGPGLGALGQSFLPATLARDETGYPVRRPSTAARRRVALFPQSDFSKGRATFGHGHFDKEDTAPRFELGFGLS